MDPAHVAVFVGAHPRVPRGLQGLAVLPTVPGAPRPQAVPPGVRRVVVAGTDTDLAALLTVLLRTDRLDVEVAHVAGRFDRGRWALRGTATRTPLIRDETGAVIAGSARWSPPEGAATILGEAVVDDTVLFDGDVAGVLVEPTGTLPGLRAAVLGTGRRRWVSGRAVQLGTAGALVHRDGVPGPRPVRRCTFYRHTTGWLRVARR